MVGNLPNYSRFDILRAFLSLQSQHPRKQLATSLEVGEGTMRTILDCLKEKEFIISSPQGHLLTEKGAQALKKIKNKMEMKSVDGLAQSSNQQNPHYPSKIKNPQYPPKPNSTKNSTKSTPSSSNEANLIPPNNKKIAVHIKNTKNTEISQKSVELRDIAIKNGAEACLIFQQKDKFQLFGESQPHEYHELSGIFRLQQNDLLILTFAEQQRWAEIAALAAAAEIVEEIKDFLQIKQ